MQYQLNDISDLVLKNKQVKAQPISVIQAVDKALPGQMMSLLPVVERTHALCGK